MFHRTLVCNFFCLLALASPTHAQNRVEKLAGTVAAVSGHTLQLKLASGDTVAIGTTDKLRVSVRAPASLDALTKGSFVGATASPQGDGTLVASEVHIFPESMRGTGEGHRPMDTVPGSTMTNATVTSVGAPAGPRNTMTNATVANVAAGKRGRQLTLTYKGGEKLIVVPEGVPVMTTEQGDASMLKPGTHAIVYASRQTDGTLAAERISIGKNGFTPPL